MSEDLAKRLEHVLPESLQERINNCDISPPAAEDPQYFKAIAHMAAFGAEPIDISTFIGHTIEEVKSVLLLDRIKDLIFEIKKQYANRDSLTLFKALLPDAIDVTHRLMTDTKVKDSTRLSAAFGIMDRALGKPTQNLEVGGSLIRDLFERMDKFEKKRLERAIDSAIEVNGKISDNAVEGEFLDITPKKEEQAPAEVSAVDKWVKENIK